MNTPNIDSGEGAPLVEIVADEPAGEEEVPTGGTIAFPASQGAQLSSAQVKAIQMMASGHTVATAAEAAGVGRATIYRWLKADAAFVAAFNAWQRDMLDTAQARLLALTDTAVNTVSKSMEKGDAKTAIVLLRLLGALRRPKPGPTDPHEVKSQQSLAARKSRVAQRKKETDTQLEELLSL